MDGRAVHRAPLNKSQRELAASATGWLWQETYGAPEWLARSIGRDAIEQEAWLAVCKAASDFDSAKYPGVPFGAFARLGVRRHLMGLRERAGIKFRVWYAMPEGEDGERFLEPADHRAGGVHPMLRAWCSEEYRSQRRALHWRYRVLLYMRYVEAWTLDEVSDVFGISRERVRQLTDRAIEKLAAQRNRTTEGT